MRLDRFVSQALGLTRSEAKKLIKAGEIYVAGTLCRQPACHVEPDAVSHLQNPLLLPGEAYFMLHKPAGFVCSHASDGYPSALELLPDIGKKLHFAGRLDADTTGLVLLSTDGQWCHRVTSPKQQRLKDKYYRVTVDKPLQAGKLVQLEQGLMLHGESAPTAPCRTFLVDLWQCDIRLSEGRYHQVKRMFAAIGYHVSALHRYRIDTLVLDQTTLPQGHFRPLADNEIELF